MVGGDRPDVSTPFFYYPESCHPVGRRGFLAAAIGATTALALGLRDEAGAATLPDGAPIIRAGATRRDDPWAISHGIRAMGAGFKIEGGQSAVEFLLATHLAEQPVNGAAHLAFPLAVEVHPNMFLKTMIEAGVPADFRFSVKGQARRFQDVIDGARALFRFDPAKTDRNTIAWSLIALARTTHPVRSRWQNAWGEPVVLADVVEAAFQTVEQASRPFQEAKNRGVIPDGQVPIQAYTCSGTHLLYSLLVAVQQGYTDRDHGARARRQLDLLVWRLDAESEMIERFYGRRAGAPHVRWFELDAKLKLLGHARECLAFARRHDLFRPTGAQEARLAVADTRLGTILGEIKPADLPRVAQVNGELHRQIIGDACHAYHGLHMA
jgi:hypothetical protein